MILPIGWKISHTPVLDDHGKVLYIIQNTQDKTAQVVAERELNNRLEKEALAACFGGYLFGS